MAIPEDSTRKKAIAALVTVLAACTTSSQFFTTLTGDRQVTATFETDDARIALPFDVSLRVSDGEEDHEFSFTSPRDAGMEVTLRLMVDVLIRHRAGDASNLVNEMQDVIRDVVHAVHLNPTLQGTVNEAFVDRVEPSGYDTEHNLAVTTIRVRTKYDYLPGVTT